MSSTVTTAPIDRRARYVFAGIGALTVLILVALFAFLALTALDMFLQVSITEFLFGTDWNPAGYDSSSWGIVPLLVGTLLVTIPALLISAPIGFIIAVYLSEIARPSLRETLKPFIEMIASIPSVVLGLLGLLYLAPLIGSMFGLSNGFNSLTAAILVGIAALPSLASISEDALANVPQSFRHASLALGASQWQTIKSIVIPAARHGLTASLMLGLGRIIGETMVVLMVAGNSRALPNGLLDPVRPMTANIAIEIKEVVVGSLHWDALFAIGLVLFMLTFAVNLVADLFMHRRV
jgi:phosphate transport system permease protein